MLSLLASLSGWTKALLSVLYFFQLYNSAMFQSVVELLSVYLPTLYLKMLGCLEFWDLILGTIPQGFFDFY